MHGLNSNADLEKQWNEIKNFRLVRVNDNDDTLFNTSSGCGNGLAQLWGAQFFYNAFFS
tara:strand:- start:429 stop:605 length:177 start_codon:yes stop_codon:yes gene_type:complete